MGDILSTCNIRAISAINHRLNVPGHMLIWAFFLSLVCGTRAQNLSVPYSYMLRTFVAKETNSVLNITRRFKEMSLYVKYNDENTELARAMTLLASIRECSSRTTVGIRTTLTEGFRGF
jgi:hypothetical protein